MTVADYIADQLFKAGVHYVFGIPGGPSIPYLESFRKAGIEFILVSNEASAGVMADVTARLTGVPGICHATFGPGATNISTGVGGALLDRSPVIVLTSEMSDTMTGRTTQMNIDHQKLFEPLTKATFRLNVTDIQYTLSQALKICMEEYPGPVHIGLPADIAETKFDPAIISPFGSDKKEPINDLNEIKCYLSRAERPVLAIGLTAQRSGIRNRILAFLDKYRIPVVITPMAKGIIPEDHPCYAGVLFHALSDSLTDLYKECDLVIGLGYDQVEYNYEAWIPDVPLIHFDLKTVDLPDKEHVMSFTGQPEEWLSVLENLHRDRLISDADKIISIRSSIAARYEKLTSHFGPVAALSILEDELPADSVVTADVGSHLHLLGQYWKVASKDNFIITNGWSGMGFGIPAALAAKLHKPQSTVACITGDGGFLMTAGEMLTARRYGLAIIVVVFSDGELNLIKLKQSWKGISPAGTTLYKGDLFESDIFLGIRIFRADSADIFRKSIRESLSLNELIIINAVIDPSDYEQVIVKK
jgi:acetolactate synthase I/II/III large subunit